MGKLKNIYKLKYKTIYIKLNNYFFLKLLFIINILIGKCLTGLLLDWYIVFKNTNNIYKNQIINNKKNNNIYIYTINIKIYIKYYIYININ